MPTINNLKRGDWIRVRFGSGGSQLAIVHGWTRSGNVRVFKFSARQKVWKGPLRLGAGEFIEMAHAPGGSVPPLPPSYALGQGYHANPFRLAA